MALTARGPGRGQDPTQTRHKTQSASPRPQRFCAVDAVRVAKEELAASGPIVKAGRLRLARVLDESTSDVGPILHEGFYKLAAAVTRPEPTLRQKATALQKSLEMQLKCLRQKGEVDQMHWTEQKAPLQLPALEGAERVETFLTQEEASVDPVGGAELQLVSASAPLRAPSMAAAAERAREEMELCIDTLLSYARETSTESRERRALLDSTSEAAAASIRKFLDLIERQAEAVREAGEKMEELQGRIRELEEDNDGLRRVVQQALKDEGEMQRQKEEKETEVEEGQQKLSEAESRSEELSTQLQKALETLRMQEEKRREAKEKLRDGGNSPMMHFSTFVLGPDQVPSGNAHISGEVKERMEPTRSESGLARRTERKNDAAQSNPTSKRDSLTSQGDVRVHAAPAFARSRSDSHSVVVSRSMTPEQLLESSSEVEEETAAPVMVKKISSGPRRKSFEEEDSESDGAVEPPRPSPLAASFPALVPFLDFQKDAESEKIKAQTVAQNHEHLEKHMVLLQEEKNKHMEQNKLLQRAVDSTLERLLVWVQAGFDSLRDFGPESVQQDAVALAAIRDMLAWLAERTCKAWIEPSAHLQQVLSSHEERVRQALELAEKQSSSAGTRRSEVDELQKALQEQTQRAEDLQQRLEEVAAEQEELAFRRVVEESTPPVLGAEQDSAMLDVAGAPARAESAVTLSTASAVPVGDSQDAGANDEAECVKEEKSEEECPAGAAAALEAEQEAQRMRLFRCPFAEAVDLTYVKRDRQFPYSSDPDDQILRLGRRQLRSFIGEVYTAKRLEDRRREKAAQPRRALHFIMQEMLRRQHGVKCLVHQRSWQILEAVAEHASEDVTVGLFADFLDGTRDLDELSFYLYCSGLVSAVPEEPQANIPPSRLPMGLISESRCLRLVELLFSDLPKAKAVVKEEIEKQLGSRLVENSYEELSYMAEADGIEADALCYALLEGWRLCCLLLSKSMPHFNWRDTVLAFIQADVHGRGWLDPNEVTKVDAQQAVLSRSRELLPVMEQTSLGAFVFRILQHLGGLTEASLKEDVVAEMSHDLGLGKKEHEACFRLCQVAFGSLERSLGVYLKWLLHSEEPRDRSVYKSVKARIFAIRRAASLGKSWPLIHNLRCLLVLLLSHQFDLQLVREEAQPEHVGWELTALLQVLRESWRRGASGTEGVDSGPDFGAELEEVGERSELRDDAGDRSGSEARPVSGKERAVYSVSFTVGQNSAQD